MKIINSSVEILEIDPTLKGVFRAIETAGRTCYKSVGTRYFRLTNENDDSSYNTLIQRLSNDNNISIKKGPFFDNAYYVSIPNKFMKDYPELENYWEEAYEDCALYENYTAYDFVNNMKERGHGAMLEHGTIYLFVETADPEYDLMYNFYTLNHFSKCKCDVSNNLAITTNYRVILQNNREDDLKYLCAPTPMHELRIPVRFICDRGTSHEIVRHRGFYGMSYAQESTRYCNYSLGKFGNELTFIKPSWNFPESETVNTKERFEAMCAEAEANYMELISLGCKAQEARAMLPNCLKTEIVVTAFVSDWEHFFKLRCAENAHPDIRVLAQDLLTKFKKEEFI